MRKQVALRLRKLATKEKTRGASSIDFVSVASKKVEYRLHIRRWKEGCAVRIYKDLKKLYKSGGIKEIELREKAVGL